MISPPSILRDASPDLVRRPHAARTVHHDSHLDSRVHRQFRRLADTISREFSERTGAVLLFCGVGAQTHVADVVTSLAEELAEPTRSRIVIVDGDAERKLVSEQLQDGCTGTASPSGERAAGDQNELSRKILRTANPAIDFLPYSHLWQGGEILPSDTLHTILAELRQTYGYVLIAGGTVATNVLAMMSRRAEASYLVVQMGAAGRTDTSSMANFLTRAGGRLLGCIATGVA